MFKRNVEPYEVRAGDKVRVFIELSASEGYAFDVYSGLVKGETGKHELSVKSDELLGTGVADLVVVRPEDPDLAQLVWADNISQVDILERARPDKISTLQEYEDAPEGTIISGACASYLFKMDGQWHGTTAGVRFSNGYISDITRTVVRWGKYL